MNNKKFFINIRDDYILETSLKKDRGINTRKICSDFLHSKSNINIYRRNIYIFIEQEKIYVKFLSVPRIPNKNLYYIIKKELDYIFGNVKNLIFSYEILKIKETNIDLIVYYSDCKKTNIINKYYKNKNKVNIGMIQFEFVNSFNILKRENNYILCVLYKEDLYIMGIVNSKMYSNSIIKNFKESVENLKKELEFFIKTHFDYMDILEKIYVANFKQKFKFQYEGINSENIGELSENFFISL